jgi:transposase-like protein
MSYTESFKIQVVKEYEKGGVSREFLKKKYGISGNSTIAKWVKKYALASKAASFGLSDPLETAVKEKLEKEELVRKLEESQLKVLALEALLEVSSELTGIDLKKKFGKKL